MASHIDLKNNLWKETPLIYSNRLSEITGSSVYLKLENLHPSHSFKYRGISYFVSDAKVKHGPSVHLVIASGGNAGLAAACSARSLGLKCTVFIPQGAAKSTTELLRREKAEVIVGGKQYSEALERAEALVAKELNAVMVPAYDNSTIWEGHSSMIHEIHDQLQQVPDAIFCSVGGGGLLGGVIVGCKAVGWDHVPIVALETIGADCFYRSMALNGKRFNSETKTLPPGIDLVYNTEHSVHLAHFHSFSSRASGSLGASEPSAAVVKMALERAGGVKTASIPDELSMQTLALFADDHKFLVELACSTTLVPAYHPDFFDKLVEASATKDKNRPVVVFIVCGGFKIDLQIAAEYRMLAEGDPRGAGESWTVKYDDGQLFSFKK
ncbi:tryptophan synthase beta subunit-like PLP-dependent enzyme [Pholiota conissans]|uniref:L-serine ammonia-lyase n=1 Tax=Pholiota conissans TaxID=109636 RepID=A0A9P6D4R5_9AGAR|nr:tryptophan synthase beta subunit-like PLP-dependent enzyme [Pholiota conissans]